MSHLACGSTDLQVRARETSDDVTLRARYNVKGSCKAIEVRTVLTVELDQPLGDRSVVIDNPPRGPGSCIVVDEAHDRCD